MHCFVCKNREDATIYGPFLRPYIKKSKFKVQTWGVGLSRQNIHFSLHCSHTHNKAMLSKCANDQSFKK
uniref:Uncharacterized protein n=1 Tax=Anguilla anguilla TaxID=7936 RepID=A0A0E9QSJ5_ANGAN